MCCRASSATCTTIHGAVALPGFYDGVEEVPQEILDQWNALNFDAVAFLRDIGLTTPAGERDRTPLEQAWSRPTCDVNGIVGGYVGEGFKTVLPAKASAKVSFRLVGKQNPERVAQSFRAFVTSRLPPDVKAEFISHAGSPAISLPVKNQALRLARRALETEWGKPAALVGSGGSIPIVGSFKRELNMDSLLVGFALEDDRDPLAQRKIRAHVVSQGRPLLGAHPGGPRRVNEGARAGRSAVIARSRRAFGRTPVFRRAMATKQSREHRAPDVPTDRFAALAMTARRRRRSGAA